MSLSKTVEKYFNKTLDKRETISNWNNMPLRNKQIEYAAIDAFILIELYNIIKNEDLDNLDLDFDLNN